MKGDVFYEKNFEKRTSLFRIDWQCELSCFAGGSG